IAIKEGLAREDPAMRALAVYCLGAIEDIDKLVDVMGDEAIEHVFDRQCAIFTLRQWLARGPGMGKILYDEKNRTGILLGKKYKTREAVRVSDLLHDLPPETWDNPETFEVLSRCLRSPRVAVAELGYSHLLQLARGVKLQPFNAAASMEDRKRYADAIDDMIA